MPKTPPTAMNSAHSDGNQSLSIIGVMGSAGTADIGGTANTLPVGVREDSGAMYVYNLGPAGAVTVAGTDPTSYLPARLTDGTTFYTASGGAGGGTFVNISSGTLNVGTIQVSAGTMVGTFLELSGSTTSSTSDVIASTDVSNYKWISVQLLNTFVGTVQVQASNDNVNFNSGNVLFNANTTANAPTIVNLNGTGIIYHGPIASRYIRLRTATLTSGTAQAIVELYSNPTVGQGINNPSVTQSGAWNVTGTVAAGTLTNLATGTLNALASGTVTAGTLTNLVSGTVTALAAGTITGGTLGNLNAGTVQINPVPVPTTLQFGTLGTAGGSFFATISAASGAGTKHYISGVDIVMQSGTADIRVLAGSSIQGTGVLTAGQFPAGGGISAQINPVFATGTNSELIYHFVGAGTAFITVKYWKGV